MPEKLEKERFNAIITSSTIFVILNIVNYFLNDEMFESSS